jgi:MOSC domain-containing protein YiiM
MIVESTNISRVRKVQYRGDTYKTGIFKQSVTGPLELSTEGVAGDVICDLVNHGGAHKAVYGFSVDHYAHWRDILGKPDLAHGAFGENLTISGLDEDSICIGDQFSIGSALLEVSQPRVPCFKLGIALEDERAPALFTRHMHTGIYFRVLKGGTVSVGDEISLSGRHPGEISVHKLFRAYHDRNFDGGREILQAAVHIAELAPEWQEKVKRRCTG